MTEETAIGRSVVCQQFVPPVSQEAAFPVGSFPGFDLEFGPAGSFLWSRRKLWFQFAIAPGPRKPLRERE